MFLYVVQYIVDTGLQKNKNGNYEQWNKIFSGDLNSDIIVLGSSRALVHYDPRIIENYTGFTCYNFGISGGGFLMQNAKWESYLEYNKPPLIAVQNVDLDMLLKDDEIFGKSQFLPYLSERTVADNLKQMDNSIWIENLIPLYKYRGLRSSFILGLKSYFGLINNTKSAFYHGYAEVNKEWDNSFEEFKSSHKEIIYSWDKMQFGFNYLRNLIQECKNKNIDLILAYAPMYIERQEITPQKETVDSIFSEMAASNNIQFWDYSKDSVCFNKEYFYNSSHLNTKGSKIFSRHFAGDLKKYIEQKKYVRNDNLRLTQRHN